ncbi:MAG: PAS domain S-box protein [Actinomycetota bacterium]
MTRLAKLYLGAALVLVPLYFLLPRGSFVQGIFHPALSGVAAAIILIRKRTNKQVPWLVIGAGFSVYALANLIWFPLTVARRVPLPFPSIADWLFLVAYTTIGAGLFLYVRSGLVEVDRGALVDAGVLSGGAAILAWVFVIQPSVSGADSAVAIFVALAYPTLDLFMMVPIIFLLLSGIKDWTHRLLAIGVASALAADFSYSIGVLNGTYHFGSFIDAGWLIFFISFGAASMLTPVIARRSGESSPLRGGRFVLLAAAALLGTTYSLYVNLHARLSVVVPLLTIALICLVLIRLRRLVTGGEISVHLMHSIAETFPDAILSLSGDGHITYLNPGGEQIFGYGQNEATGMHVSELLSDFKSPTDLGPDVSVERRDFFELTGTDSFGRNFPVEVHISDASSDGSVIITAGIRGLSARKAAEVALSKSAALESAILGSLSDGLLITDLDKRIVLVNAAFEKLTGWKEEELLGRRPQDVYPVWDDSGREVLEEERVLSQLVKPESETPMSQHNITIGHRDGAHIAVAINGMPILVSGKMVGAVATLRDLTSEREIDQLKSSLVSTVSHELRTPLTMITGLAELLLSGTMTPESSEEGLRLIYSGSLRLGRLIEDLLSVSRIESGSVNARIGEVELSALISETVSAFGDASERIILDGCSKLPTAMGDADLVVQILTNLLSNALKYSDPPSHIQIRATVTDDEIETSITDHGIGLTPEDQDRLFQKFSRIDRPEVHAAGGTGLGLYITKNLVESQGGRMSVSSQLGEGSTFSFVLPLARESQEALR